MAEESTPMEVEVSSTRAEAPRGADELQMPWVEKYRPQRYEALMRFLFQLSCY